MIILILCYDSNSNTTTKHDHDNHNDTNTNTFVRNQGVLGRSPSKPSAPAKLGTSGFVQLRCLHIHYIRLVLHMTLYYTVYIYIYI